MVTAAASPGGGILKRAAANAGLLLGGKSAAGVMQLATFALAARALGLHDFGVFSVVIAQVMLLTGLAAFESNQAVIRYGVPHLAADDRGAIQALFKAGTALDLGAAAVAALATVILAPLTAHHLGWDAPLVRLAQWVAPLAFANAVATPKGMLRLFGRFDLLTAHAVVTPAARLVLVGALAATGASLGWYFAAWVAAGWAGAAVGIAFAWREARRRDLLGGLNGSLRGLSQSNPGIWRFTLFSNLYSSLALIPSHLSVVMVAAFLGEAAAGLFRIAREFGMGLLKPVDLVNQALFPDMARLVAARDWSRLVRTAVRAGLAAAATGALLTLLIAIAGPILLRTIFGASYVAAAPVLVAIGAATAIRVLAFAADPIMYALGRPSTPVALSVISMAAFVGLMAWRLPRDGLVGAGWAFIGMGAIAAVLSALAAARMIRAEAHAPGPVEISPKW